MTNSQWHKFYSAKVDAPPEILFELLSDLPNYQRWLPTSEAFSHTTDVDPYLVQLGSEYHDGKPDEPGKDWWGTVSGFQPPGSIDFHQTIRVTRLRATADVHIHYSFEWEDGGTRVGRWLVLDVDMPILVRPLRSVMLSKFDRENLRTMAAVKQYAETLSADRARDEASGAAHDARSSSGGRHAGSMVKTPGPGQEGTRPRQGRESWFRVSTVTLRVSR